MNPCCRAKLCREATNIIKQDENRGRSKSYKQPRFRSADTEISRAVQDTVRKLTIFHAQNLKPFRYLDLPQEIRFAILEQTDLVCPDAVQWRPRKAIKPSQSCIDCDEEYGLMSDMSTLPCSCCFSPSLDIDNVQWCPCCGNCSPEDHSGICYCSIRSPVCSSSCKCFFPRRTLLSVSSQVRRDAIAVYYACNQIRVTPYNSHSLRFAELHNGPLAVPGIHFMPKIELSLYLSSIARNALQHIRWLEWILPSSQRTYLLPRTSAWYDYLDTILLMKNGMNLSGLTFTINIAQSGLYVEGYSNRICRMPLNQDAWKWYETIILPMRCLGEAGLKDFFVHLRWHDIEKGRRAHHERDLERAVMGKDYSSPLRGKPAERLYSTIKRLREERAQRSRDEEAQRGQS
jgi:hypothetical protein